MKILHFPIIRITFWLVLGIVFGYYVKPNLFFVFGIVAFSFLLFLFLFFKSNADFVPKKYFGIGLFLLTFTLGLSSVAVHTETFYKNHFLNSISNFTGNYTIQISILEKLKTSETNYRFLAKINQIDSKSSSGKLILNVRKSKFVPKIIPGNRLEVNDDIVKKFKPNNPNQFDYGQYLEIKSVYGQIFTDISKLKISSSIDKNIWYYAFNLRETIIDNLKKSGFQKQELSVINALILGQQQDISPEVIHDYQYAGAVHILSVSGLHVGFILFLLTFLLRPIPETKLGKITKLILILIFLWLFAVIAGLAPSVVRSAVMFSFIAVGRFLNKETNIYNTLIVSVFLILLFEPFFLFDIGFQLSYIAVFFILWLQPLLKLIWKPKNKIAIYFWDILTVSFAAQIGTLPLSIYYFHQFPGLFFVTNLVLIPILSIIMGLGLVLMILAYFDFVPHFLVIIVEKSIFLMNLFIKHISSIEQFSFRNIPLSFSVLLLSYLLIFGWIVWFKKPNFKKLVFVFSTIIGIQSILIFNHYQNQKKQEFIVFNTYKKTIFARRIGKNITVYTNDSLPKLGFEKQMVQNYATANYCLITKIIPIANNMVFNKNKILVLDDAIVLNSEISPDVVILKDSPKINIERLLEFCHPKIIIADATNYKSYVSLWKNSCLKAKIPFHSTYEKGYYLLN
jgi:competence protein ComEC